MGLFDSVKDLFRGAADFGTDIVGGAFASLGERAQGGRLSTGPAASRGRAIGVDIGNIILGASVPDRTPAPPSAPVAGAGVTGRSPFAPVLDALERSRRAFESGARPRQAGIGEVLGGAVVGEVLRPVFEEGLRDLGELGAQFVRGFTGAPDPFQGPAVDPLTGRSTLADNAGSPLSGVNGSALGAACGQPFGLHQNMLTGQIHARGQDFLMPNPVTGTLQLFGPLGRIVLTSRDVSAARKVRKLARRFGGRRPR